MGKSQRLLMLCIAIFSLGLNTYAQTLTSVSGNVKNSATKESVAAVSVTIKGSAAGSYTDDKGNFKFTTTQKPPFTLIVNSIGYEPKEVEFNGETSVNIELNVSYALGQDVVVSVSRLPQRIMEAASTVDRVNASTIRNTPGASYYDALNNLKGVDITTSSYTFKTVSTRGFNGSGNLRFNQLVDGMDNAAPALNFSVSNVIGLTELDVDNMELLSGASSALYGNGGMNGTLLVNSKDPFKYQGVSFQIKQGVNHVSDNRHSAAPFYDWSFRWGKKVSEKFAFKVGAEYIRTNDWVADDSTNLLRNNIISNVTTGTRASDPNFDGVNVFGDEVSANMRSFAQVFQYQTQQGILDATGGTVDIIALMNGSLPANATPEQIAGFIGALPAELQPTVNNLVPFYFGLRNNIYAGDPVKNISRTGYNEKDVVNYDAKNIKISGGLYYNISNSTQLSLTGNWGSGTTVYTGADRYSLKNFRIGQYKLELKSKNWMLRGYTTQENSGDSYASTLTAIAINNSWKDDATWFGQYVGNYSGAVLSGAPSANAHAYARTVAETGRILPGSAAYNSAFETSVNTSISNNGSQFADKSSVYHFEGQYNLSPYIKIVEVLVGGSYRWYHLNSGGTIFADGDKQAGTINISELGGYIQLQKALLNDVLKLSASGRYDKNKNFEGRFTPRVTASVKVAKDNHIRLSYQQAYRFPNNQDQWINLKTPGSVLIGCLPYFNELYDFANNPVYTIESVVAYRADFAAQQESGVLTPIPNFSLLKEAKFEKAKPETMQSFEIGYRGLIAKKLLIDAYYYFSKYKNFIGRAAVARGASGDVTSSYTELLNPFTSTNYSFVQNSPTPVKASGWGIGAEYAAGKGYTVKANVYGDQLKDVPAGLITFFNTPKTRYNLGFGNANAFKGIGFNILYKWQDEVAWEGTFGTGTIPSFGTMDFLLSYKMGKSKNLIKLGATNLFNNYYRNAFGNPYIGGLYYVSFGYNVF